MSRLPPIGQQIHAILVQQGSEAAASFAREAGQIELFERINAVAREEPVPNFLHSALCAMSLPVRKPADDKAPILRRDGQYALAITPKPVLRLVKGQQELITLGVPYGSLPRLILIHIMTEAVRSRSRHIQLGASFTDWLRHMNFRSVSYGPRGSATLVRNQLDRLLACEWMIRWDGQKRNGESEFGIKEIKLADEYVGQNGPLGVFTRDIILTEGFFEHLRQHAVPLNEHAIRELRDSATALDLYSWLAYRLPRISGKRPATLSWQQLAVHFGNDGRNPRKFRQTVRDVWERQVSGVYPEARVEFDTGVIRLYASLAPLQRKLVPGAHLKLVTNDAADEKGKAFPKQDFISALTNVLGKIEAQVWLAGATMAQTEEGAWQLVVASKFKADWIRGYFSIQLERARIASGLTQIPDVVAAGKAA